MFAAPSMAAKMDEVRLPGRPRAARQATARWIGRSRPGAVGGGPVAASQTAMRLGRCAVQRQRCRSRRVRRRSLSRCSGDRAIPYTVADEGGAAAVLHLWGDPVQHLWLSARGRLWIAPPACSCACVAASRSCCVPTAITARCIAAHRARSPAATSTVGTAPSATRTAAAADSSMLRERLAGVGANAACVRPAQTPTSIE